MTEMHDQKLPPLDKEGYLIDLNDWSAAVAEQLAKAENISLSPAHWQIIDLLRAFYAQTDTAPAMRALVRLARQNLGTEQGSSVYLMGLFGGSPAKVAAKVAGLPRPTNCL
jgi:tRNA 2-thiouridine synthesizing protein E|tara:strand:+ start:1025 stop:1357 length:333 start_codon:yes stop_codon:yes gene_type:complete